MRKLLLSILAGALFCSPALADWTGKDASSATITFKNPNTCSSVVCVPVVQLYDGTNTVTLTTAGANGTSNTLTGVPTYDRMNIYNGSTWDRWTGAVTVASGGIASGAIASGAIASGALASGAGVDGWDLTQGTKADAAWVSGSGSVIAILKNIAGGVGAAIPAGGNIIGKVGIDQTTPGTTNSVSFGTDPCTFLAKTNFTGSQTAGTQIITGTSSKKTYICSLQLVAQAAEIVNIIEGTGTVCATGSAAVMGSTTAANGMSYVANGGISLGAGTGTVIFAGNASADNVCITQSGSSRITYQGTYVQN